MHAAHRIEDARLERVPAPLIEFQEVLDRAIVTALGVHEYL
jgi:hypothetical protein